MATTAEPATQEVASPVILAPGATVERTHSPARAPTALVHGAIPLPADWKTLPTSAVLWRSPEPYPFTNVPIDDTILTFEGGNFVAHEARTGAVRWAARLARGDFEDAYFAAGCGVAVSFEGPGITARALSTGRALWRMPLTLPSTRAHISEPGSGSIAGCTVAVRLTRDGASLATPGQPATRVLLDARDGRRLRERADAVAVRAVGNDYVIIEDTGERLLRVPTSGGEERPAEARPCPSPNDHYRGPELRGRCVRINGDLAEGVDGDGTVAWTVRVPDGRWELLAIGREHALLGQSGTPLVIDLAPATGEVRSVRWRPCAGHVTLAGDLALFEWYEETVVVDLALEGAPIREVETLEADVERSMAQLDAASVMNPPNVHYPTGPRQARFWLRRILPLARPFLLRRVSRAPLGDALALVTVLGDDNSPDVQVAIAAILERSFRRRPTLIRARLRAAASRALHAPLDSRLASRQSRQTIAWIHWLSRHGAVGRVCGTRDLVGAAPAPCDLDEATWDAIRASRDALDAASFDPAPAEAVHAGLAALGANSAPQLSCTPTEDDLARSAALRTLVELAVPPANVHVEASACIDVVGISGRVAQDPGPPFWSLALAPSASPPHFDDPRWDAAPKRIYEWSWYAGPLQAQGGRILVARVNGVWRTLSVVTVWMS